MSVFLPAIYFSTSSSTSQAAPAPAPDPAVRPYWNACVASWSRRLWLPRPSDSVPSSPSSSTWFNHQTTHHPPLPLPTSLFKIPACKDDQQEINNAEGSKGKRKVGERLNFARKKQKAAGLMRSLKIRMYPNAKQKNTMKKWLGCAR